MADINQPLTLRLLHPAPGQDPTVPAHLLYDRADPWAVRLCAHQPDHEPVVRHMARDRLAAGVDSPVGVGDVSITPAPSPSPRRRRGLMLTLRGAHGQECQLLIPRAAVTTFLDRTWLLVPAGAEWVDWDAVVGRLLGVGGQPC